MNEFDTDIGGQDRHFPSTTWGRISSAGGPAKEDDLGRLERFCQRYWKPIYSYVRATWRKSAEDSKDLTQAFFLWLLEGDALQKYAPQRGSFRGYLKILLKGFVGHHQEALRALKRGGRVKTLSLDGDTTRLEDIVNDPQATTGEKIFDRVWLSEAVRQAVERIRERFRSEGREKQMRAYELYEMAPGGDRPTYAQVADQLGLKESDVRNYLFAVREEIRRELRAELAEWTTDDQALQDEWNELFSS